MALTATWNLNPQITLVGTPELTTIQSIQSTIVGLIELCTLTDGTGLNKCNLVFVDRRSLAGAATENLDMYSLINPFGAAQVWACVKAIHVKLNTATVGASLQVGGLAATTAWNSFINANDDAEITLGPGGSVTLVNPSALGYAVTNTTNHLLKILNDSSPSITQEYDIIVVGATATS